MWGWKANAKVQGRGSCQQIAASVVIEEAEQSHGITRGKTVMRMGQFTLALVMVRCLMPCHSGLAYEHEDTLPFPL